MHYQEELVSRFPIRKKGAQKDAFLSYVKSEAEQMGFSAHVEDVKNNRNLVAGNPETAKVVFTAHYDTPAGMFFPNFITPRNIPFYIFYQLLIVGGFILCSVLAALAARAVFGITDPQAMHSVFMLIYFILLALLMAGPANKNNANDNTSGCAALLCIMQKLPEHAKEHVAFIFFDNEEKHMLGSGNYAKQHKQVKKNTLIINLDCVGYGEHLFAFAKKKARAHAYYPQLRLSLISANGKEMRHVNSASSVYPSDQASFDCGVAICACKKAPVIGYYVDRIHTKRDTICDISNLDYLADAFSNFAAEISR